jgi:hypothetical protein
MRFCSEECKASYIARLENETLRKIELLHPARGSLSRPATSGPATQGS